ncbi:MAG TPA: trypsin-like peptidase domain-containing protein [Chthoniobacterales bacterium]|jgi:S1-C subfamily serine protease
MKRLFISCLAICTLLLSGENLAAQAVADPASEPSVVATAKAMPAVVNINTERIVRRPYSDPADLIYERFFGEQVRPRRSVAQKVQSLGSGFIIDPEGYIVTNEHVVERAADLKIFVTTSEGETYTAKYVTGDPASDLALIKIDAKRPLPFISLENLSPNYLGQTVLVLGNPMGYGSSVARGILSAKERTIEVEGNEFTGLIQTDAAINPGNSGGPVIDLSGKLVGVSSVKMAFTPQGVPTQGIGFAISAETVRDAVKEFRNGGTKQPKGVAGSSRAKEYFGLETQDLTEDLTEALNYAPGSGVLVASVEKDSPAAKAGIRAGLVVYHVDDYAVHSNKDLEKVLSQVKPGSDVVLSVGSITRRGRLLARNINTVTLTAR